MGEIRTAVLQRGGSPVFGHYYKVLYSVRAKSEVSEVYHFWGRACLSTALMEKESGDLEVDSVV